MLDQLYKSPTTSARYRTGPLGFYLDGFVSEERRQGFAILTVHGHLRVIAALNRWVRRRGTRVVSLREKHIQQFLQRRRGPPQRRRHERRPLLRLLLYLRQQGVVRPAAIQSRSEPHDRLLRSYGDHLRSVRGLTPATVSRYQSLARAFLRAQFPARLTRSSRLGGETVSSFIVDAMRNRGRKGAKELVIGLRAFLRWLQFRGWVKGDLAAAVPCVADWRLRSLPPALTPPEVERALRSCNLQTPRGLRDHAVLLLLSRLGLRAGEIVHFELDDIDWRAGELMLRRKPGREERMPLPVDVGRSLSAYLKRSRPACSTRRVFLCMDAPHRGFKGSSTVSGIVAAALRRAGLNPGHRGSHLFRHTLARTLLQKGASFPEIGDLLGHRQTSSTEFYAKVDFAALRSVARPWPGGAR